MMTAMEDYVAMTRKVLDSELKVTGEDTNVSSCGVHGKLQHMTG
jgi:hypothetical protein